MTPQPHPKRTQAGDISSAMDGDSRVVPYDRVRRVQRQVEYGDRMLAHANPLSASLGGVILDLLAMCNYFRDLIDDINRTIADPVARAAVMSPLAEQYYKSAKQLDRMLETAKTVARPKKVLRPPEKPGASPGRTSK